MTEEISSSNSQTELKTKFTFETLKILAQQGQSSSFTSIVVGGIVFLVLRPVAQENFMFYWLATLVVLSLMRFFLAGQYFRMEETSDRLDVWLNLYLILIYLSGLCWGILPLTHVFRATENSFAFVVFIVAGMSAGSLVWLYAKLNAILPYLLIMLIPLIYSLSVGSAGEQTGMAVTAGLYLVMLVRSAFTLNASARRTLQLEIQNSELFEFLLKSNRMSKDESENYGL